MLPLPQCTAPHPLATPPSSSCLNARPPPLGKLSCTLPSVGWSPCHIRSVSSRKAALSVLPVVPPAGHGAPGPHPPPFCSRADLRPWRHTSCKQAPSIQAKETGRTGRRRPGKVPGDTAGKAGPAQGTGPGKLRTRSQRAPGRSAQRALQDGPLPAPDSAPNGPPAAAPQASWSLGTGRASQVRKTNHQPFSQERSEHKHAAQRTWEAAQIPARCQSERRRPPFLPRLPLGMLPGTQAPH